MARSAAFFDLDRTLLRRSSALALAGSFREHGVIGRGQLAKAAAWQLLFAARGASAETVRKAAEDGLMILKGFRVEDLRNLVATAMEPILKPLVYQEPLHLVTRHRERGEPVYIVSATLQEIVEELARELGFDGAIGSWTASTQVARSAARTERAKPPRSVSSLKGKGSTWQPRLPTPTATRTCRSSTRSETRSSSIRTASSVGSRSSAAGPSSSSASSPIRPYAACIRL
jgi:hypothetical protein